jgi:hypothetical protein
VTSRFGRFFTQLEARVEAHVCIAFLAYRLHVTLAPGLTPRSVLEKFAAVQMIDARLPTTDGRELLLSRYTEPEPELNLLLKNSNWSCSLPVGGQGGCNTAAMNQHLCEISSEVAADAHAVVILDGAGWRNSDGLMLPRNITLLVLPSYSPELNPVERIWHYLRSHWLANSVSRSWVDIMDACEMAWNRFATNTGLVRSLCAVAWAPASYAP